MIIKKDVSEGRDFMCQAGLEILYGAISRSDVNSLRR